VPRDAEEPDRQSSNAARATSLRAEQAAGKTKTEGDRL